MIFFSDEKQYFEVQIFKAIETNTVLEKLTIKCYNITPKDIENLISAIRKNPQLKLKEIIFDAAWFNKGANHWGIEQKAIDDYLAIRPLEITLQNTINKFEACASALSKELIENLTKIFDDLKKYDKYKKMAENLDFPAVKAIKAVIALADEKKYLIEDYHKLTQAPQCYDIFNELDESIDITSLDANKLKSLIDRLLDGANIHFQAGKTDLSTINRLNYLQTKITQSNLLETEHEEIFGILKTIKYTSYAFTMQTYQELGAKYPSASQELGNIYFNKTDPKYKILAALYFFQAGINANQELLRACKQLMLTTFADQLNMDTAKDEQLSYLLKFQFDLQVLLKNANTDELVSAYSNVLDLIATETTIENQVTPPKQEIVAQLQDLMNQLPENEKLKKSCEVIIKHVKDQQPKPDDVMVPDRDNLYAETQKYLEEYSPKFGKPLTEAEKEKQPLRYAVAVYVRILLELSDPITKDNNVELFKRMMVAQKLWSELTPILPFYQEIKQIYEPIFLKYINNFNGETNENQNLSILLESKIKNAP